MSDADRTPHELAPAGCASAGTGYLMPDVRLYTAGGVAVALGEHGGRRNLVVVLRGDGGPGDFTPALLAALAASGVQIEAEEARVVVIGAVETAPPWAEWPG